MFLEATLAPRLANQRARDVIQEAGIEVIEKEAIETEVTKMTLLRYWQIPALLLLAALTACTQQQQSPQEIREKTAAATADVKNDAKAVAEGLKEGWNRNKPLDVNTASRDQLMSLPGMSATDADRVIAGRPYNEADDLETRHIISKTEYDRISGQVSARK